MKRWREAGPAPGTYRIWCSMCDKYLAGGPAALQQHQDTVHFDLRPWHCDWCDAKFGSRNTLEQHSTTVHLGLRLLGCTVEGCGKSFTTGVILRDHMRVEHGHAWLCCPHCDATFAYRRNLNNHKRRKHYKEV